MNKKRGILKDLNIKDVKIKRIVSILAVFIMVSVTWNGIVMICSADGGGEDYYTPDTGVLWNLEDIVTDSSGTAISGSSGIFIVHKNIHISPSDTLVILWGNTVKFDQGKRLIVEGRLIAQGTSRENKDVIFTSNQQTPSSGDWDAIDFLSDCDYKNCYIKNCIIEYATDGIRCFSSAPNIEENTIRHNLFSGIYAEDAQLNISNNEISNNEIGVVYINCPDDSNIENNLIKSNSDKGILLDNSGTRTANNEITQNGGSSNGCGIFCENGNSAIISNNEIYSNSDNGIICQYSYPEIDRNEIYYNKNGIKVISTDCTNEPTISSNIIYENEIGIMSTGNSNYLIKNNTLSSNSNIGVSLISSSPEINNNLITAEHKEKIDTFKDELQIESKNNVVIRNEQVELKEQLGSPEDWDVDWNDLILDSNPEPYLGIVEIIEDHWEDSEIDLYIEAQASSNPGEQSSEIWVSKTLLPAENDRLQIHFAGEVDDVVWNLLGTSIPYEAGAETIFTICNQNVNEPTAKHIKYSTYNDVYRNNLESLSTLHEYDTFYYGLDENDNTYYFISNNWEYDIVKDVNIRAWFESYFANIDWEVYPTLIIEFKSVEIYTPSIPDLNPKLYIDYILHGTNYEKSGEFKTTSIDKSTNPAHIWDTLTLLKSEPENTNIKVTVLDASDDSSITGFVDLDEKEIDISSITQTSIKLKFNFYSDGVSTPILDEWKVTYDRTNDISIKCVDSSPKIKDSIISADDGNAYDLDISSDSHPVLINTSYQLERITISDTSDMTIDWYMRVKIKNSEELPLPNVIVGIKDKNDNEIYNGVTNEEGYISNDELDLDIICTEMIISASSRTYFTPHKIYTKEGDVIKNNVNVIIHTNKEIQLYYSFDSNSDSDLDLFPDMVENNDNILWFDPQDYVRYKNDQIIDSLATSSDKSSKIIDETFPLIGGGNYKLYMCGRKSSSSDGARISLSVDDGSIPKLIDNDIHFLTKDFHWYSTPMFYTTNQYLKLTIDDVNPTRQSVYIVYIVLVRFAEGSLIPTGVNMGQITNPLISHTDSDGLKDGLEVRENTFWFEAEDFPAYINTPIIDQTKASNSKAVLCIDVNNPETIDIPVELHQNENYIYYIRAKAKEKFYDYNLITYDDFSEDNIETGALKWKRTEDSGSYQVNNGYLIQQIDNAGEGFEKVQTTLGLPSTLNWELVYKGSSKVQGSYITLELSDGINKITHQIPVDVTPETEDFYYYDPSTYYLIEITCDGIEANFYRNEVGQNPILEKTVDISFFDNHDDVKLSIGIYTEFDNAVAVNWDYVKVTNYNTPPSIDYRLLLNLDGDIQLEEPIQVSNKYNWYYREIDNSIIPYTGTFHLRATDVSTTPSNIYVDKIMIAKESEILIDEFSDGSKSKTINSNDYDPTTGDYLDYFKIHKDSFISKGTMKLQGSSTLLRITNEINRQECPRIWEDKIVWQEEDGSEWDIVLYDLSEDTDNDGIRNFLDDDDDGDGIPDDQDDDPDKAKIVITTEYTIPPANQENPAIWENRIVWQDDRNGWSNIFMYDLSVDTDGDGIPNYKDDDDDGDDILDESDPDPDEAEYLITRNNPNSDKINPSIWGDIIIWQEDSNGYWDISYYDLTINSDMTYPPNYMDDDDDDDGIPDETDPDPDPAQILIETDDPSHAVYPSDQINPKIYEDKIVWQDNRNDNIINSVDDWDIYLYLLAFSADIYDDAEHRITIQCSQYQKNPNIYGERIVFTGQTNINLYFISMQTTKQITGMPKNRLEIFGDKVIWDDLTTDNIYIYDISSDSYPSPIVLNDAFNTYPAIYDDLIVWSDFKLISTSDIFILYQYYEFAIGTDLTNGIEGSIIWTHTEMFSGPESTNDFSTELNDYLITHQDEADPNGFIYIPLRFHSETLEPLTISDINIEVEYLTDPLDGDTDRDLLTDDTEINGYFGCDIVEFEDVIEFKEWKNPKLDIFSPYYPDKKLYTTTNTNFIHQTGVTLTTTNNYISDVENARDSWVKLKFHSGYTDKYIIRIEPKDLPAFLWPYFGSNLNDLRTEKPPEIVETFYKYLSSEVNNIRYPVRINDRRDGFVLYDSTDESNDLNQQRMEIKNYFEKIIANATYIEIKRDGGQIIDPIHNSVVENPIVSCGLITRETDLNIPSGKGAIYGYYDFYAIYNLTENTDYTIKAGLDFNKIPCQLKPEYRYSDPDTSEVPTCLTDAFNEIVLVRLIELDCIRIYKRAIDPLNMDFDEDQLSDGFEATASLYPLNADPDHDGLNDYIELITEKTNLEYRDTDYDCIRDGVELGYTSGMILGMNGDISSLGSWMERIARWDDPFDFTPINNFDADPPSNYPGSPYKQYTTDPKNPDTDDDGLPDGWLDGWEYLSTQSPLSPEYWRYDPDFWGFNGEIDNMVQIYEGEDHNLDGSQNGLISQWSFDPFTYERTLGSGETKPNFGEVDSDADGIPDGYEVWYSHIDPIKDDSNNYFIDPINFDSHKDAESNDREMNSGSFGGDNDFFITESANVYSRAQKIELQGGETYDDIIKIAVQLDIPEEEDLSELPKMEIWWGDDFDNDNIKEPITCLEIIETYTKSPEDNWYVYNVPDGTFDFNNNYVPALYIVMTCFLTVDDNTDIIEYIYSWKGFEDMMNPPDPERSYRYILDINEEYVWESTDYLTLNYKLYENDEDGSGNDIYGDELINYYEYIYGTNPKNSNTDHTIGLGISVDDQLKDGAEVGLDPGEVINFPTNPGSVQVPCPIGGTIFRTNVDNGVLKFNSNWGNPDDWIEFDGDGEETAISAYRYNYHDNLVDPIVETGSIFAGASTNNQKLLTLEDKSSIWLSADGTKLFLWSPGADMETNYLDENGNKFIPGTCLIFENPQPADMDDYTPSFNYMNQDLPLSNVYFYDSDFDNILDGLEINWNQNCEIPELNPDKLINCWDKDSDNDGIPDNLEIYYNLDVSSTGGSGKLCDPKNPFDDNDNLENMIDPDSDGDGIWDGNELDWNKDTDGDGLENMVDPDSDNDGLPDGWADGYIWDPSANYGEGAFVNFNVLTNPLDPNRNVQQTGVFDLWEGEDHPINGIRNGIYDKGQEPCPIKKDTDNDGLYDGFDIYDNEDKLGELYDKAYGERKYADNNDDDILDYEQEDHTSAIKKDTDEDGIDDYTEIFGYLISIIEIPNIDYIEKEIYSDPSHIDTDRDSVTDKKEFFLGTDLSESDTDDDGLSDYTEISSTYVVNGLNYPTNPIIWDTDRDHLPDGGKDGWIFDSSAEPNAQWYHDENSENNQIDWWEGEDKNLDGVTNQINGKDTESNPRKIDSDDDFILDWQEYYFHVQYTLSSYSDSNGFTIPSAIVPGKTPSRCVSDYDDDNYPNPADVDSDNDGLDDFDENCGAIKCQLEGTLGSGDNPHFSEAEETNPYDDDSDDDLIIDGNDLWNEISPGNWESVWDKDSDVDGLINAMDYDSDDDYSSNWGYDGDEDTDKDGYYEDGETDPLKKTAFDNDEDGLPNDKEDVNNNDIVDPGETDPNDDDTDEDGIDDGTEGLIDIDGDGLINALDDDSDWDGILDQFEPNNNNFKLIDSDGDGLLDGQTIKVLKTSARATYFYNYIQASIHQYIQHREVENNYVEFFGEESFGTNPNNPDTDLDDILDFYELDTEIFWFEVENINYRFSSSQVITDNTVTEDIIKMKDENNEDKENAEIITTNPRTIKYIKRDPLKDGILFDSDGFQPDLFKIETKLFGANGDYYRAFIRARPNLNINNFNGNEGLASIIISMTGANFVDEIYNSDTNSYNEFEFTHLKDFPILLNITRDFTWYPTPAFKITDYSNFKIEGTDGRIAIYGNDNDIDKMTPEEYLDDDNTNFVDKVTIVKISDFDDRGFFTDPLDPDTDDDCLCDGFEKRGRGRYGLYHVTTDPFLTDTDGDGLWDGDEEFPALIDKDKIENVKFDDDIFHRFVTNPKYFDTDFDGLPDGEELSSWKDWTGSGYENPDNNKDKGTYPSKPGWDSNDIPDDMDPKDSDGDGIEDGTEPYWKEDTDHDGVINAMDVDSDNDGFPDGWIDGWGFEKGANGHPNSKPGWNYGYGKEGDGNDDDDPMDPGEFEDKDFDGQVAMESWYKADDDRYYSVEPWNGEGETDPVDPDTDGDGVEDGEDVDPLRDLAIDLTIKRLEAKDPLDYTKIDLYFIKYEDKADFFVTIDMFDPSEDNKRIRWQLGTWWDQNDKKLNEWVRFNVPDDYEEIKIIFYTYDRDTLVEEDNDLLDKHDHCDASGSSKDGNSKDILGYYNYKNNNWDGIGTSKYLDTKKRVLEIESSGEWDGSDGKEGDMHEDDVKVKFQIEKVGILPKWAKEALAAKYSPILEYPRYTQVGNFINDIKEQWSGKLDSSPIYTVLDEYLSLKDNLRLCDIDTYLDNSILRRHKNLFWFKDFANPAYRNALGTYVSYDNFLDLKIVDNWQDWIVVLDIIAIILSVGGSFAAKKATQEAIEIAKKAIDMVNDVLSDLDYTDAIEQLSDESDRTIYANVFGYEYGKDNTQYIVIQYWIFYPYDTGNWLLNFLLKEAFGLSTENEGDWEMIQIVLKEPSDYSDSEKDKWKWDKYAPTAKMTSSEGFTYQDFYVPAVAVFDESGYNEKRWMDELLGMGKVETKIIEEYEGLKLECRYEHHPIVYVTSGTHEMKIDKPIWNTPEISNYLEYNERWEYDENGGDFKYDIEIIDCETDFIRFAGKWGYDYILAKWAVGPPGPMQILSQPWWGEIYWKPWMKPLDISSR